MVKQLRASETFASELVPLGYGHPLWHPEPAGISAVEIGDVGYIDDGCFYRLFNACYERSHPSNKDGVPENFRPLVLPRVHTKDEIVKPGDPLCSDSTRKISVDANVQASPGPVSVGGSYSLSVSGKRGAVAILKDGGTQHAVSRSAAFRRYILDNHMAWHAFATRRELELRVQDIVLVSGVVRTSAWALAAYSSNEAAHDASISVSANGVSAGATFSTESSNKIGLRHREGPSRKNRVSDPSAEKEDAQLQDQCVFVQYYKCHPKILGMSKIRQPQNLKKKDVIEDVNDDCFCAPFRSFVGWLKRCFGGCCGGAQMDVEQPVEKVKLTQGAAPEPQSQPEPEPVEALLEYMSQSSPKNAGVISHADVYELFKGIKWPESIAEYLKETRPEIIIDENGAAQIKLEVTFGDDIPPTPPSVPESPSSPEGDVDFTRLAPEPLRTTPSNRTNNSNSASPHSPVANSPSAPTLSSQYSNHSSAAATPSSKRGYKWKAPSSPRDETRLQPPTPEKSAPAQPIPESEPQHLPQVPEMVLARQREMWDRAQREIEEARRRFHANDPFYSSRPLFDEAGHSILSPRLNTSSPFTPSPGTRSRLDSRTGDPRPSP